MLAANRDKELDRRNIFVVSTMKLALKIKDMATFNSVSFMPQQEYTTLRIQGYNGLTKKLEEAVNKWSLTLSKSSCSFHSETIAIKGFSEDYSESHDQITSILEAVGVPRYIYGGYQFFNDMVWFETVVFNETTVLLSNFLSSHTWRPKWAQFKFTGEIVNHGNEIFTIKLPRFKQDYTFVYPITENEYNSFSHCHYHSFAFDEGIFIQIIEFPPIFVLKGFTYAVDFFERFLEINGFDLTDYGEDWFPGEQQVKKFYL